MDPILGLEVRDEGACGIIRQKEKKRKEQSGKHLDRQGVNTRDSTVQSGRRVPRQTRERAEPREKEWFGLRGCGEGREIG